MPNKMRVEVILNKLAEIYVHMKRGTDKYRTYFDEIVLLKLNKK